MCEGISGEPLGSWLTETLYYLCCKHFVFGSISGGSCSAGVGLKPHAGAGVSANRAQERVTARSGVGHAVGLDRFPYVGEC